MKTRILSLFIIFTSCHFVQSQPSATGGNPPNENCTPAINDVDWEKNPNIIRFNIDPLNEKLNAILKWIPGGVRGHLTGNFELANYSKTGCCNPQDTAHKTLTKDEISGMGGIGVDTGRLPIPGISLPGGAGGLYIGASTDISLTLSGSVEDVCDESKSDLCVSATLAHNINLYGGLNVVGDTFDLRFTGNGNIQGTATWCKSSGWDVGDVCGGASATLTFSFFENDLFEHNFGDASTCE
jgi:hypothetical protein